MNEEMAKSVAQMMEDSPFPWKVVSLGRGLLAMHDATGAEVPLFRMLAFAQKVTGVMAKQKEAAT